MEERGLTKTIIGFRKEGDGSEPDICYIFSSKTNVKKNEMRLLTIHRFIRRGPLVSIKADSQRFNKNHKKVVNMNG